MKSFKTLLNEKTEADIENFFKNRSVGIISAERGNLSSEENLNRSTELKNHLISKGHRVIDSHGGYTENYGTPEAKSVYEKSFIVGASKKGYDNNNLHKDLLELGKKYQQDSILHKDHDSDDAYLHGTSKDAWPGEGAKVHVGSLHMGETGEFHTRLNDGRTFVFREKDKKAEAA